MDYSNRDTRPGELRPAFHGGSDGAPPSARDHHERVTQRGSGRGRCFSEQRHSNPRNRLPPYARRLTDDRRNSLAVLVGSAAWDRAKSETWFPGRKVLLPPGEHPSSFDWSLASGFPDAVIVAVGDPEPADIVRSLAAELLSHVGYVLHIGPGPVIRFEARRSAP